MFSVVKERATSGWTVVGGGRQGYQVVQGLIAFADWGRVRPSLTYGQPDRIPAVHTD